MKHRSYGVEEGTFLCTCRGCRREFRSPTALGEWCSRCRRRVIDRLPLTSLADRDVMLPCGACHVWTLHAFARRVPGDDGGIAVLYRCTKCGTEVRYGYEEVKG